MSSRLLGSVNLGMSWIALLNSAAAPAGTEASFYNRVQWRPCPRDTQSRKYHWKTSGPGRPPWVRVGLRGVIVEMSIGMSSVAAGERRSPAGPQPEFAPETSVVTALKGRRWRLGAAPFSLILHGAAILALVLVPLLAQEQLPEPSGAIRAFLVEPPALAAPPPPPPPPAPRAAVERTTQRPTEQASTRLTAPVEVPDSVTETGGLDVGFEGGVPGGVEGGVPGGVVGGIIGGLPEGPPPPVEPLRVGSQIREPLKVKHVDPVYPRLASVSRLHGAVVLECLISADGLVTRVEVLRGVPILTEAAVLAVKQWVYRPTLLNGVPIPVIMTVTVTFNLDTGGL